MLKRDARTGKHPTEQAVAAYFALRCQDDLSETSLRRIEYNLRLGIMGHVAPRAPWLEDVSPLVLREACDECTEKRGPAATLGLISVGRSMWGVLRSEGLYLGADPWVGIRAPRQQNRRTPVTAAHMRALENTCVVLCNGGLPQLKLPPQFAYAIRVLMRTGCRRSEIFEMRWSQVQWETGLFHFPTHKTSKKHGPKDSHADAAMPIMAELYERKLSYAWCFPATRGDGPIQGIHARWKRLREHIGCPQYRIHDIRHGLAVAMHEAGADLTSIAGVLTHRDTRTTARYVGGASRRRIRQASEAGLKRVFDDE